MVFAKAVSGLLSLKLKPKFLKDQKTYIVPTSFGFVFGTLALVLLLFSIGSGNNLVYIFTFILISVAHSSMILTNSNVKRLQIESLQQDLIFAETPGSFRILIGSKTKSNIYEVQVKLKNHFGESIVDKVAPGDFQEHLVPVLIEHPGTHKEIHIEFSSTFPFGLLKAWKLITYPDELTCYPKPEGPFAFPKSVSDKSKSLGGEFKSHRHFSAGDSVNRIDWRASAKTENLLIKELSSEAITQVDIDPSELPSDWGLNKIQSQLTLWAINCEKSGLSYRYKQKNYSTEYSFGRAHLKKILDEILWQKNQ